ncbi:MAG: NAD-dependent epimerase/dehydratase family protein [Ruminococcaceae bacterium]|nr:NAD-dependent epimerase/dehydratase family protein [Oscillospiraceae bacterium]
MENRILITGKNSYIGDSFSEFVHNYPVDIVDMQNEEWKNYDFSSFDTVVHVAAIVHKQEKQYTVEEYKKINTTLAYEVAKKAKESKVKQFVFLSTMSVYGVVSGVITKDTKLNPFNDYGKSKLQAERLIQSLEDESFKVTIIRPPLVYGKGCKGNYKKLRKFALKLPFFPDVESSRSMIYIGNLCSFMKKAIDEKLSGVFCVQDGAYVNTSQMVKLVANANGKDIKLTKVFNPLINMLLRMKIHIVCKVFGSLTYDFSLCPDYEKVDLNTAIKLTEE